MKLAFEELPGDGGLLVHTDTGLPKIPELQAHRWRDGQEIVLLLPDAAPEDQNLFVGLAQIPGVASVQTVGRYQILFMKGRLFQWAPIREHIIQAFADLYDSMIEIVAVPPPAKFSEIMAQTITPEMIQKAMATQAPFDVSCLKGWPRGAVEHPEPVEGQEIQVHPGGFMMSAAPPLTDEEIKANIKHQYYYDGYDADDNRFTGTLWALSLGHAEAKLRLYGAEPGQRPIVRCKVEPVGVGRAGDPAFTQWASNSWS